MANAIKPGKNGTALDHVVQGLVTIRVINPPGWVASHLVDALGPSSGTPDPDPDILVSFVHDVPANGEMHFAELHGATFAFDDGGFYLLDRAGHKARIDIEQIGDRCEMVCEPGIRRVPLLVSLVAMRLLSKGHALLHSSAFVYQGEGILVTGWQSGGKSEVLLAFLRAGASYLSDEWTIVSPAGAGMFGLSRKISIWGWQFRYLPRYWARISRADRNRVRLAGLYRGLYKSLSGQGRGREMARRLLRRVLGDPAGSGRVEVDVRKLTGKRTWQGQAPLDRVLFTEVTEGATRVDTMTDGEIADRMIASQSYERHDLWDAYDQFRFAFPARTNPLLDQWRAREWAVISEALEGVPAHRVSHPYPVDLGNLYRAVAPLCTRREDRPLKMRGQLASSVVLHGLGQ